MASAIALDRPGCGPLELDAGGDDLHHHRHRGGAIVVDYSPDALSVDVHSRLCPPQVVLPALDGEVVSHCRSHITTGPAQPRRHAGAVDCGLSPGDVFSGGDGVSWRAGP